MNAVEKDKTPLQALLIPKPILYFGKFLDRISPWLASRYAARLFLTPFKYPLPHREKKMFDQSKIEEIEVNAIRRKIIVYTYGNSQRKVLLVHGWSGTGTQLSKIADALLEKGFSTVSFDAPAHGKAPGKISMMPFFIESIQQLNKTHGSFEYAIGHSLGGMSLLRSVSKGLSLKKLAIIGTANSIAAITKNFTKNMQLREQVSVLLKSYFDQKFGENLDNYSGAVSAKGVHIPTLVVHDKNDVDVHYSSAIEIKEALDQGHLLLTEGLGHRKILGNSEVIQQIVTFLIKE